MIIKSIHLKEGLYERSIALIDAVNIIHSQHNSRGKTTLLRFILYALGYHIPSTRKIKFKNCEATLVVECEKYGEITLFRHDDLYIEVTVNELQKTYVLPEQLHDLHALMFGTESVDILNNLLGAFYVDQEKGWTLLNRGTVIGSIHFNIEELIRGLSGCDCSELIQQQTKCTRELSKYRQMSSIAQYRKTLDEDSGTLVTDSYEDQTSATEVQMKIELQRLSTELKRIDRTLSDNNHFKKFISGIKLFVEAPDGTHFLVTEKNIVGLSDSIDFLVAKRKMVSAQFASISRQLAKLEKEKSFEMDQLSFCNDPNLAEIFDKKLASIPMDQKAIKRNITRLEKEIKALNEEITRQTKVNNSIMTLLADSMIRYLTELGLGDATTIAANYLFTSNLKELSGAVLHKTAFAFRLAYIIAIESVLDIKLPIILDSPSGKEVDKENIELMMTILKRDFSDHQLIIASIFSYNFDAINSIEIIDRLIDSEI